MLRKSFALERACRKGMHGVCYSSVEGEFRLVDVKENIVDKDGNLLRAIVTQKRKYVPVNEDEFFHRGESVENYTIKALQSAGVELKRINTPYERMGLMDKSAYAEYLDMAVDTDLRERVSASSPVSSPVSNFSSTQNVE